MNMQSFLPHPFASIKHFAAPDNLNKNLFNKVILLRAAFYCLTENIDILLNFYGRNKL